MTGDPVTAVTVDEDFDAFYRREFRAMVALARAGLTQLLVEGGGELAAALLREGLVDELHWFLSNRLLGGDGRPALADLRCLLGRLLGLLAGRFPGADDRQGRQTDAEHEQSEAPSTSKHRRSSHCTKHTHRS